MDGAIRTLSQSIACLSDMNRPRVLQMARLGDSRQKEKGGRGRYRSRRDDWGRDHEEDHGITRTRATARFPSREMGCLLEWLYVALASEVTTGRTSYILFAIGVQRRG